MTEEWQTVDRAAHEHGLLLPPNVFIKEILAIRRVAEAIACRAEYRDYYRRHTKQMGEIAKFLRKPHPIGMPPLWLEVTKLLERLKIPL